MTAGISSNRPLNITIDILPRKSVAAGGGDEYVRGMRLTEEQMIKAMTHNDASFNGLFYVGVHSTGIYCLPSCKARQPLLRNIVFYPTREEAIAAGLRGCKRCYSDRYPDTLPSWVRPAINYMNEHRAEKLNESKLAKVAGVDITTMRRHFKQQVGVTPLQFHRKQRLRHAKQLLERGSDFLTAAYECGYESASGFREAFQREFGIAPGKVRAHE